MILDTYRIDSTKIEKIDDPSNIINPEYKKLRWYSAGKKVHYIDVVKGNDGEFYIDIRYSTPKENE